MPKPIVPTFLTLLSLPIQLPIQVINFKALFSDHNRILLEIFETPITSLPPSPTHITNWYKYADTLINLPVNINPSLNTKFEIDSGIEFCTNNINMAILNSSNVPKKRNNFNALPDEIIHKIKLKNRLRKNGNLHGTHPQKD